MSNKIDRGSAETCFSQNRKRSTPPSHSNCWSSCTYRVIYWIFFTQFWNKIDYFYEKLQICVRKKSKISIWTLPLPFDSRWLKSVTWILRTSKFRNLVSKVRYGPINHLTASNGFVLFSPPYSTTIAIAFLHLRPRAVDAFFATSNFLVSFLC